MYTPIQAAMTAIGTANPPYQSAQSAIAESIAAGLHLSPAQKRLLKSVYKSSGIENRYSVLSDFSQGAGEFQFFPNDIDQPFPSTAARMAIFKENALNLAISAIHNCFSQLPNFNLSDITHLITVSCTGMYAPGLDIEIVHQLKLNSSTKRTAVNFMGCYGAFNAIKLADAFCKSEPGANVLIVSVELCTLHFQRNSNLDNMVSNAIFADGAAAVLIQSKPDQEKYLLLQDFHSELLPQTQEEMAWHIGDSGFDIVLSSYVPEIIESGIAAFTEKLFARSGLSPTDIDFYAIHPGGIKILEACEAALNITADQNKQAYQVLRDYGNMSSATILFVLKALFNDLKQEDHQKNIFSCAFGPGLTLESMILKVSTN